jgi:hypothetical protein
MVTTDASGVATAPVATAGSVAGTYQVTAVVNGVAPAVFALTNTASLAASVTVPPVSVVFSPAPQAVTLKATVKNSAGAAISSGTVQFSVSGTVVAQGTLTAGGLATATYTLPGNVAPSTLPITARFTGGSGYAAATGTSSLTITKRNPVVTWATPADITAATPLSATQLKAVADTPGAFTYTPAAGSVLPAGSGQVLNVKFVPTDAIRYNTVTATTRINVLAAPVSGTRTYPVITWATPADITVGTPLSATQQNATSNVPGVFTYSPAAGTVFPAGYGRIMSVRFVPADTTRYYPVNGYTRINVLRVP